MVWIKQLRIHQWLKNLLVFAPLLAAHQAADHDRIGKLLLAFLAFNLAASSVYLINDITDIQSDRAHPTKKNRPIAAGLISAKTAILFTVILVLLALSIGSAISWAFEGWLFGYLVLTFAYSNWLKKIALVDVIVLTAFYLLRIIAGGTASQIPLSFWLQAFAIFLFLSLAFAKRFTELQTYEEEQSAASSQRGYEISDAPNLKIMGIASGYAAIVILALYLDSATVQQIYVNPKLIWLVVPVFTYWINWIWLEAGRGNMHEDPIVFAVRRRESQISGILFLIIILVSDMRIGY